MLNKGLFLYAFMDCSTDIEVVIIEILENMAVHSVANHSLPFFPKLKHEKRPKR